MALDSDSFALGKTCAALAWSDFGWSEMSQFSVSAQVETRNVPESTIRWIVSSEIIIPCSMQSMPASSAAFTAVSPGQWGATRRPRRCASSAITVSSSVEYCCAPGGPVGVITPPEAQHLISFAPCVIW